MTSNFILHSIESYQAGFVYETEYAIRKTEGIRVIWAIFSVLLLQYSLFCAVNREMTHIAHMRLQLLEGAECGVVLTRIRFHTPSQYG
jgi:hypothetical protein